MRLSVDEAFQRYGDRVFSAAFAVCHSREDADDAVQDTFVKYYTRNEEYADENHLKAWLLRVAINRARDIAGSFWRKHRVSLEDYMDTLEFSQPEDRALFESVMKLPRKYRMALYLHYVEEYSSGEIARILKIPQSTVLTHLSRGRKLLRKKLAEAEAYV